MSATDVRVLRARLLLGVLRSHEFPALAVRLLEEGHDAPELGVLATESNPVMSEVEPLLRRALESLDCRPLGDEEAVMVLLRDCVGRLARGELPPREGLQLMIDEVVDPGRSRGVITSKDYACDSLGLHELYGAYWAYDDLLERPSEVSFDGSYGDEAIERLDRHVRALASDWLGSLDSGESRGQP